MVENVVFAQKLKTQNIEKKQIMSMMMSQNPENIQKMVEENETLKKKLFELTVKSTNVEDARAPEHEFSFW